MDKVDLPADNQIMEHNSQYLFFHPQVKELIEDFSYCFDVKITFFSPQMYEYIVGYHTQFSDFCTMLQTNMHYRYRCLHQDNTMCSKCRRTKDKVVYKCYAGLMEAIIPIIKDDEILVYVFIGQFRTSDNIPEEILTAWKAKGYDESQLVKAFMDRPCFSNERLERMLNILQRNIEFIVSTEGMKVRRPELVEEVMIYIEKHLREDITIKDVSASLSKSESTISHTIKKELGISFKDLLIDRRLKFFEHQVIINPALQIKDAIENTGYEDALYFSRLYKKKRGCSPSSFINGVRASKGVAATKRTTKEY